MVRENFGITRRSVVAGAAGIVMARALRGTAAIAQEKTLRIGSLIPLTGTGSQWGGFMKMVYDKVVGEVNDAGGIAGTKIVLFNEDDQGNSDAGVRAARKLIDVDQVSVIIGLWASGVAASVLPLCWTNKVMAIGEATSDNLLELPHQGYYVRTGAGVGAYTLTTAEYGAKLNTKAAFLMLPQAPYGATVLKEYTRIGDAKGFKVNSLIYDQKKTSFRSEADQAMASKPDLIFFGGYVPDSTILARELFRAGFNGVRIGFPAGITKEFIAAVGPEIAEGAYRSEARPGFGLPGYKNFTTLIGRESDEVQETQCFDHINLAILSAARSLAKGGDASGTSIRDNIRKITEDGGEVVGSAVDGIKILAAGKEITYRGATGPCQFTENGDVKSPYMRIVQVKNGAFVAIT